MSTINSAASWMTAGAAGLASGFAAQTSLVDVGVGWVEKLGIAGASIAGFLFVIWMQSDSMKRGAEITATLAENQGRAGETLAGVLSVQQSVDTRLASIERMLGDQVRDLEIIKGRLGNGGSK